MMELVVYASERIMGLKECPAQAANKSFLQLKYQRSMQGLVFISIFRPNAGIELRRIYSCVYAIL